MAAKVGTVIILYRADPISLQAAVHPGYKLGDPNMNMNMNQFTLSLFITHTENLTVKEPCDK